MCTRSPDLLDSLAAALPGLREPLSPDADERRTFAERRRLRINELRDHVECSIVGTCLTHTDLLNIAKRCRVQVSPDVTAYDLHAHFVEAVRKGGPLARAMQKLLDRRHEGILRIVGRARSREELEQIWRREYDAGRIAGAYWAFQTYSHIPQDLAARIFGEVHMLSHVLGRTIHAAAERASELAARVADLEAKIARDAERHRQALQERDAQIAELRSRLIASVPSPLTQLRPLLERRGSKRDRAVLAARERAKLAEARIDELLRENAALRERALRAERAAASVRAQEECPGALACRLDLPREEKLKVLYLGGRKGSIEQLRAIAEGASAEFYHHDGGVEQAFQRISDMVERCHVVFCPVDCINHRACLLAKHQCQRMQKAFVPLRSAGGATFKQALSEITRATRHEPAQFIRGSSEPTDVE
jgi:hypothetical protein